MRLFIAIPLPDAARAALAELQNKLVETRAQVRWTDPGNYHLTIKFLGDTDDTLVPELSARLTRVATQVPAFPIELEGLGHFPEKGPARVIVAHAFSPDQRLTKLHRLIDSAVGGIGLPMDTRELVPHLTLGRVQANHGLNRLLRLVARHETHFVTSFTATQVILYASQLMPEGSHYTALHTAALVTPAPDTSPTRA